MKPKKPDKNKAHFKTMSHKQLRHALRTLRKAAADCEFYLDVRNEQGRGGK